MNRKLQEKIRNWKPVRGKSQLSIPELLNKQWGITVSPAGTFEFSPMPVRDLPLRRLVYTVDTIEEALALRGLLCFQTMTGRWRLYWVRRTGLFSNPIIGAPIPVFSADHFEWISAHIYRCWCRYVNPARRRQPA